jgi:hypothetical protein
MFYTNRRSPVKGEDGNMMFRDPIETAAERTV